MNRTEYDVQKRAAAGTRATLRAVVTLYVIYMGYRLLRSAYLAEESAMPMSLRWGFGIGMIAFALAFGFYALKRWRADIEAARLPRKPEDGASPEGGEGPEK